MLYLRSAIEVGGIYAEAARECYYDACSWLGKVINAKLDEIDTALCDAINRPEDEL
jgi:hypothetical protein